MQYRYEDLEPNDFQRLCQGLLAHTYRYLRPLPLNQRDGGADAYLVDTEGSRRVAYQVKWTRTPGSVENRSTWIEQILRHERANIERISLTGVQEYVLITNVESSAQPGVGSLDRADAIGREFQDQYGLRLSIWWRSDVDRRLDSAPNELKLSYPEILVGTNALIAALRSAMPSGDFDQEQLLRNAIATEYRRDQSVGFRQAGLENAALDDVHIDVEMRRAEFLNHPIRPQTRGAVAILTAPRTVRVALIYGAPGQGKSTLTQFVCQQHRRAFLDGDTTLSTTSQESDEVRIPIRILLRDYSTWLQGLDPLTDTQQPRPPGTVDSIEGFSAHLLSEASGGRSMSASDVMNMVEQRATLFMLDGLDEVADQAIRQRVSEEIDDFVARTERVAFPPRIYVTARPSFDKAPEPRLAEGAIFELVDLSSRLQFEYLNRWSRALQLRPREVGELRRLFKSKFAEEDFGDLLGNPMQLTLVLYLLRQRGESTPTRRTALYADYLKAFLDRESEKSKLVRIHRLVLEKSTQYLGWLLQSTAERDGGNGRMAREALVRHLRHYLSDNQMPVGIVDDLFTAVSDRIWAIKSRESGVYEFDVQSFREYFAALYIFESAAPNPDLGVDAGMRFSELLSRPYWANVLRFFAGMFRHAEQSHMADIVIERLARDQLSTATRALAQTLLRDGVFEAAFPRRRVTDAAFDPTGIRMALREASTSHGPANEEAMQLLEKHVEADLGDVLNLERMALLRNGAEPERVRSWWMSNVVGPPTTRGRWMDLARALDVGSQVSLDPGLFDFSDARMTSSLLRAGFDFPESASWMAASLASVMSGLVVGADAIGSSFAAVTARAFDPGKVFGRVEPEEPRYVQLRADSPRTRVWSDADMLQLSQRDESLADELAHASRASSDSLEVGVLVSRRFGCGSLAMELALHSIIRTLQQRPSIEEVSQVVRRLEGFPTAFIRVLQNGVEKTEPWDAWAKELSDQDVHSWVLSLVTVAPPTTIEELLPTASSLVADLDVYQIDALHRAVGRVTPGTTKSKRLLKTVSTQSLSADLRAIIALVCHEALMESKTPPKLSIRDLRSAEAKKHVGSVLLSTLQRGWNQAVADDASSAPPDSLPVRPGLIRWNEKSTWNQVAPTSPWPLITAYNDRLFAEGQKSLADVADAGRWFEPPR